MSKMGCMCGFVMTFNTGREDYDLALIQEALIEDIGVLIQDGVIDNAEKFYDSIDSQKTKVFRCPNCNRLWVEHAPGHYRSYVPEVDSTEENL